MSPFDQALRDIVREAVMDALATERAHIVEQVAARIGAAANADEYLTTTQAAKMLRVHPDTLRGMVAAGKIPRREIAGHLRFARADLDKLLQAGEPGAETAEQIVERMVKGA